VADLEVVNGIDPCSKLRADLEVVSDLSAHRVRTLKHKLLAGLLLGHRRICRVTLKAEPLPFAEFIAIDGTVALVAGSYIPIRSTMLVPNQFHSRLSSFDVPVGACRFKDCLPCIRFVRRLDQLDVYALTRIKNLPAKVGDLLCISRNLVG